MAHPTCLHLSWLALSLAIPLGVQAQDAPAEESDATRLDYRAPEACPPGTSLSAEVAARLGRAPFVEDADATVLEVQILETDRGWLGTIASGGGAMRSFRSAECAELVQTLASVIAVALDTERAMPEPTRSPPASSTAPMEHPSERDEVLVSVRATGDDQLTLFRATGSDLWNQSHARPHFERLCTAPCEARIPSGHQHLAVAAGTGDAVSAEDLVPIDGRSTLDLRYEDRTPLRILGGVGMLIGLVGSIAAAVFAADRIDAQDTSGSALGASLTGLALGVFIAGEILVFSGDAASVQTHPHREPRPR